jgi:hypothetical protein
VSIRVHITQAALEVFVARGIGLNLEFENQNPWQNRTLDAEQARKLDGTKWVSVAAEHAREAVTVVSVKGD